MKPTPGDVQRLAMKFDAALVDCEEGDYAWEQIRLLVVSVSEWLKADMEQNEDEVNQFLEDAGCYDLQDGYDKDEE